VTACVVCVIVLLFLAGFLGLLLLVRRRNAHLWLPAYLRGRGERQARATARATADGVDVMFAFVDHFEPVVKPGQDPARKAGAMDAWVRAFPELAGRHRDSDGRPPRHTWTYPFETYRPDYLERLIELCRRDLGEVEVHIHHDADTSDSFRAKMREGLSRFAEHGLNTAAGLDGHRFAFVHGNWSLDNSRPDGRWCGVNDELIVLRDLGCFADFTLPSAPSATQTEKINAIYYATDDPARPKSHNTGVDVEVGRAPSGDLMIVQGPLLLSWADRKLGVLPRIDNAAVTGANPATPARIDAWVELGIGVRGRPEWVFVKVHAHGANAADRNALLGDRADAMFEHLEQTWAAGNRRLHYVTAREMYNIIKAAEAGKTGNPDDHRDFEIPPYDCLASP
jgi:hypothetical protein